LALEADIRLATRSSRFAIPAARIGIAYYDVGAADPSGRPGTGGGERVRRGHIDGVEAERIGLVTRAVDDAELNDRVIDLARRIAANAPLSIRASKAALREAVRSADPSPAVVALAEQCRRSHDLVEGLAAFAEGRTPAFDGE